MTSSALRHSWLARHFDFRLPAIVDFVGGGGKTSLILSLMQEYVEVCSVLYTTTTRIHPPAVSRGLAIISTDDLSLLKHLVNQIGGRLQDQKCRLVATRASAGPALLRGVEPTFAQSIERDTFPLILNEADGARSMSIKVPRDGEPVLMEGAEYLVPVIGLDCLNRPLGPDTLFRWELAAERMSLQMGAPLTPELAAGILLHRSGVCKGWKPNSRIIVFINKVDLPSQDALAMSLAHALISNRTYPVEKVVWGSLERERAHVVEAPVQ
jgi:probable selenium-dependent hydroxylase accessory protein YqeC